MKKILLLMTMVLTCVGAWAEEQLPSSNQCYHITSKDANRGAFYAKPGEGYLSHCGASASYVSQHRYHNPDVTKDPNSPAQQFAFVEYNEKLYLYSVSEKKFAQKDGNFIKLVDSEPDIVTINKNGNYWNIKIKGTNKLNFSGGYDYGVYANYENNDDGNNLVITEAGDFDPTEALNKLKFGPLESDMSFNWSTSTTWNDTNADNLPSTVLNDNELGYGIKYIEQEMSVAGARTATVTFQYTSGNCALNVRGVEVIDSEGRIVAGDYHVGKTGTNSTGNVYTVKVAEAGTYKVRCYSTFGAADRADATNGNITVALAYPENSDFSDFSHDVTFAAEYATLHLGYKVAIPEDVEAYVVNSIENGYAKMTQVEDVIPAATPVILKLNGNPELTYTFAYTADAAGEIETNLLKGSIVDRYVAENAYVLSNGDDGLGLYLASMNQLTGTAFLNNANKVYLPATAVTSGVKALRFNFDGETTAIETVETENANAPIYDLSGRRVVNTVKGGIYIQNGKKFIVK